MDTSGLLTLVGVAVVDGLGAPLGGATAVFRLTCTATPVPDLDQFPAVTMKGLAGRISTKRLRLHATLLPGALPVELAGTPTLLAVEVDGAAIATVDLPGGLTPHGRRAFVGESAAGTEKVVVHLRGTKAKSRYAVSLRVDGPLPALPAGRSTVTLTSGLGGLPARASGHAFPSAR